MAGPGLAILSGLLHGLGAVGQVERERRERERLSAEKAADRAARENEQFVDVPQLAIPSMFRVRYTPDAAGNVRVKGTLLPIFQALSDKEEAKRNRELAFPDVEGPTPSTAADPYAGIASAEQLAAHAGFQGLAPEARAEVFNRLNREGRFGDTGPAPPQGQGDTDRLGFEAWLATPEGRQVQRGANEGLAAGTLAEPERWVESAYRQKHPMPSPAVAAPLPSAAPAPQVDPLQAQMLRMGRYGSITGNEYLDKILRLREAEAKLREAERQKYTGHIYETETGQYGVPFSGQTGMYGAPQRLGEPKPRAATGLDKQMAMFDESLRVQGVDPASDLGKVARANYAKSAMPIPEGGMSVASADAALSMARAQLGQRPGMTPSPAPGAPGTPRAPGTPGVATPSAVIKGNTKPVEYATAQGVGMMEQSRVALGRIKEALTDPEIDNYLGPYDQARANIKRWTPLGLAGEVPPAVVDLDQNLATVTNYTVRLITGAQMNKEEVPRIMGQIVTKQYRGPEFRQRLDTTIKNIRMLEARVIDLALRGDQKARMVAEDTGLLLPGQIPQGGPATTPGPTAPGQTVMPLPYGKADPTRDRRIRETATGRTGILKAGTPLPQGVELLD